MTGPDIAAIEARLAAATPGPWVLDYEACDCGDGYGCPHGSWPYQIRNSHHQQMTGSPEVEAANTCDGWPGCKAEHRHAASEFAEMTDSDAELIAHAPADLAALLAEVKQLRAGADAVTDLHVGRAGAFGRMCSFCQDRSGARTMPWPCVPHRIATEIRDGRVVIPVDRDGATT